MIKNLLIGILAVTIGVIGIVVVLSNENALVINPKGIIAREELSLIITNIILMLSIVLPTYIFLFVIVWKYCLKNSHAEYDPDHSYGTLGQLVLWLLPTFIVVILAFITWEASRKLDPYRPIQSDKKPLTVQVVALNWKWLFIYPEQGIATLNYFHIPELTPIHLRLAADHAPMNSFWIPELSGQIYSMAGMTTQLFLMADGPGSYTGRAVEINGEGYADMNFSAKSTSAKDFDDWVAEVKKSPLHLTEDVYDSLVNHYIDKSVTLYADVDKDLFHKIVHKYMYPTTPVLWKN